MANIVTTSKAIRFSKGSVAKIALTKADEITTPPGVRVYGPYASVQIYLSDTIDGQSFATTKAMREYIDANFFYSGGGTGAGVQSVNGDTGPDVVLDAGDIGAATAAQGLLADTAVQPSELQNVVQVSANKTLELTENLSFQNVTATSTITIPTNASVAFPIGAEITVALESGTTTIAAASGVTTVSLNGNLVLDTVGQVAVLKKTGTDTWFVGINGGA